MKRLSSFMVMNIEGSDRISYTYNEVDKDTGEPISDNNKKSFYAVDQTLSEHIDAIREYIQKNKRGGD